MNVLSICDPRQWACQQWSTVQLGDPRRTRRAVRLGTAIAQQPEAGLPAQTENWADLKAAYRLLNHPTLTHSALCAPHIGQTLAQAQQAEVVLFIQDTSELDYSTHPATTGLGHIGNRRGRGIMLHTCLAIAPADEHLLGLAYQKAWVRQQVYKGSETRTQRRERQSESDLWAETLEALHSPPPNCTWVSVGDRGSDVFSFMRHAKELGWHYLVRVCQDRRVFTATGEENSLFKWLRAQPAQGSKTLNLRGRDGKPARPVELQVSWTAVEVRPPRLGPEHKAAPIAAWCVRGWEAGGGEDALEWMLLSSVAVTDLREALERLEWYSRRWLIEEYHKCLKTGCRMEQRQLKSYEGLLGLLGFVAIVAVRLLQLRSLSRGQPEQLAQTLLPQGWVAVVSQQVRLEQKSLTVGQFWRGVAQMGGFLGRKGDGEPGWQSLWSGWRRLMDISWGMSLARDGPSCG